MNQAVAQADAGAPALRTVFLCFLAALCEGIDIQAAGVTAAGIRAEFHPGNQLLSWFFAASTLGLFIGAALGGPLADRIGRKKTLVGSMVVFGLFSLLTLWAHDMLFLIAVRLLAGIGLGGSLPNLIALGAESAGTLRRSASVTLIYSGMPLGGALASLVTLLLMPSQWRWVFGVGGVAPLLVAPLIALTMPESAAFRSLRGASRAVAQSTVVSLGEVLREGRAVRTLLLWVSFFLALITLHLLLNWLPTLLGGSGLSNAQTAAGMIGFNLGGAIGAVLIGNFLETRHRQRSVLLTFVGLPLLLLLLAWSHGGASVAIAIVFVLGIAVLAAQSILYAYAPLCYPTRIRGTGVGFAVAAGRLGSMTGPLLGGVLMAGAASSAQVLTSLLPLVLIGSVCAMVLAWQPPPPTE